MTTDVAEQKRRNDRFHDCDGNRPFSGRGCSSTSDKRLKSSDGSSPSIKVRTFSLFPFCLGTLHEQDYLSGKGLNLFVVNRKEKTE